MSLWNVLNVLFCPEVLLIMSGFSGSECATHSVGQIESFIKCDNHDDLQYYCGYRYVFTVVPDPVHFLGMVPNFQVLYLRFQNIVGIASQHLAA